MEKLAIYAAELARRLASRPATPNELQALELLAIRVLEEVSAARRGEVRSIGETSGMWRAVEKLEKH
ncbi:MAG TPA: hypothetical protein VMB03_14445 [Bryobacteraceae bacterium]|nr:hypothetical protein [Bryobacteraceae bacterium]